MLEFTHTWVFLLLLAPALIRWLAPPHRESRDSLQVPYFQRLVGLSGETPRSGASIRRRLVIQAVGPRIEHYFDRPLTATELGRTRLVVIGEAGLDQTLITAALQA